MLDPHIFTNLIPVAHAAEEVTKSTNPVGVLGLDARLFIAQLINFAIILFILWKWVFTPVAKKLQERTDRIEKSLHDADRVAKDKQEFETWRNAEMSKTRTEASEIITRQTEAIKAKDEIAKQTKSEQERIVEQAKEQITQEKNKALQDAKGQIADLVTNATEKILRQKLDEKKDAELIKQTLQAIK